MNSTFYTVGKGIESWREEEAYTLTFIVTEDCNLRCKYCYVTHKSNVARMELKTAKRFIDYIFEIKRKNQHAVILDFIGGEPLLEVELIDEICDYFKYKAFLINDEWYWNYRISICTNGINYDNPKVQNFIEKNYGKLSISITIDGTKEKHDMQRIFPNGEGSYESVKRNIPMWLEKFEGSTKVTFSSDDLPMLKDSIVHLWNMGITEIAANVVFEDVWKTGDDKIFENQLRDLADYIIENDLYDKYKCTLFDDSIGAPETDVSMQKTSCGAGIMLALGVDGKIYPCQRYYKHSLNKKEGYVLGDVDSGLDLNKIRVFGTVMKKYQCDQECLQCDVASGCMFCQGASYDEAETKTNFQRAKYICKMHKARVRANNYYFARLKNIKGIMLERDTYDKRLNFILSNNSTSFCCYKNKTKDKTIEMRKELILEGLNYAYNNFMKPVFIHGEEEYSFVEEYLNYEILHIVPLSFFRKNQFKHNEEYIITLQNNEIGELAKLDRMVENIILNINSDEINFLSQALIDAFEYVDRINLNILELSPHFEINLYKKELYKCADFIICKFKKDGIIKELNVLTDIFWLNKHEGCSAGEKSLSYAPDGKIYICPAYYLEDKTSNGQIYNYQIANRRLYYADNFPICQECDNYHCERCVYLNEQTTCEVNVSPDFQCKKAFAERKVSLFIKKNIEAEIEISHDIDEVLYDDAYQKLKNADRAMGLFGI